MKKLNWFQRKIVKWFLPAGFVQKSTEPLVVQEIVIKGTREEMLDQIILQGVEIAVAPHSEPLNRISAAAAAALAARLKN